MVCIPCFIVPVVLFFWRWLIQPYFIKYIWNPWQKKDEQGNLIKNDHPEFIKNCEGGVCTFMRKPVPEKTTVDQAVTQDAKDLPAKKDD